MRKMKDLYKYIMGKYNGMPVFAILAIVLVLVISGALKDKSKAGEKVNEDFVPTIQQSDVDFINDEDDTLSIFGIKEIKIKEGSTEAELYYVNPEQNTDKYFITVSITLKESNEVIYTSDLIPPGMGITKINISHDLKKGTHPAVFHIQGYKMNDFSSAKGADFDIEIIVE